MHTPNRTMRQPRIRVFRAYELMAALQAAGTADQAAPSRWSAPCRRRGRGGANDYWLSGIAVTLLNGEPSISLVDHTR